ncbi:GON-4-like protein [Tetranychus urticae]|uniref:GON-4-like protein n=1 Tax=Tetranychus urticae TaxID=32264 RepID=T1KRV2_TETUR|nr:GON-4-like protein [Tetranychus urticae]
MDHSSPNKSIQPMSIFDLLELDEDENDDEYNPAEEEEVEDEEEEIIEDLFMGDPCRSDEPSDIEMSESDTIARRTRSKFQIEEEPKDTKEFPDVTEDLYEPAKVDDDEWLNFLNSLYQDNPSRIFDEDEAKDPDYSVFEDVDELAGKENHEAVIQNNLEVAPVEKIDLEAASTSDLSKWSAFFTDEDVILLHHQMAQHVQLLTQQYLLTMTSQTMGNVAENAAFLIKEINQFACGKEVSIFRTPNLPGALKILEDHPINPSNITVTANSWRQCPVPVIVRPIIANNPHVFQYHHLLPRSGFPDIKLCDNQKKANAKTKTKFSLAEDHLIALGLEQFSSVDKKLVCQYIKQLLLPVKSVDQIRMHIKNKRRHINDESIGKCDESNPITFYIKYGKLLPIPRKMPQPKLDYSNLSDLPEWLAKHLDPNFIANTKTKVLPRLKLSPLKGTYSLKYPSTLSSPNKETSIVLRRYRYLSKLPYIKPKPMPSLTSPEITVINVEKTPSLSPPISTTCEVNQSLPLQTSGEVNSEDKLEIEVSDIVEEVAQSENIEEKSSSNCQDNDIPMGEDLAVFNSDNAVQNEDDDESDLAALMVASSTITSNKGRNKSHESSSVSKKEAKKSLVTKHKESTVLLLSEDWLLNDYNREQKEQIMVQCFINKVREALKSDEDYVQFLNYLNEFGKQRSTNGSIKDLHQKTEKLLRKVNAQQVMEDFVLLLNASEAQECGKMYQYLHWRRYLSFIRKLEVYSAVEPNCIPRLHKTLVQLKLSETPVNKQRLKAAVSKAISGHPYLINEFSSLFLDEKPKDYLFANDEDFDNIAITNAQDLNAADDEGDDSFENVMVDLNGEESKYGTNACPCKICHNNVNNNNNCSSSNGSENATSAPLRHCASCSLKFIGGKIYLQGPKKIQPAEVQYLGLRESRAVVNQPESASPQTVEPSVSVDQSNSTQSSVETESCNNEKPWTLAEDKLLLEFCKAKVSIDDEANLIELFKEISCKLNRPCDNVVERFNKLMDLFKHEKINQDSEKNDSN